jgi:hypothetical protein
VLQAPEVLAGDNFDDRCDIFSFGIVMYNLFHRCVCVCVCVCVCACVSIDGAGGLAIVVVYPGVG